MCLICEMTSIEDENKGYWQEAAKAVMILIGSLQSANTIFARIMTDDTRRSTLTEAERSACVSIGISLRNLTEAGFLPDRDQYRAIAVAMGARLLDESDADSKLEGEGSLARVFEAAANRDKPRH